MKSSGTAGRSQKKKSSRLSSEKSKTILPIPTLTNASLMPLLSSSDDEKESPRKELLKNYLPKTPIHSNVSVQNLIEETQTDSSNVSLKSPLNTPMEKSATKKKRKESSKRVSRAIKQEMFPQNLDTLDQVNTFDEISSPSRKSHKISSPGKKGHEISSPGKKGHEVSSPGKKGHKISTPGKKDHNISTPGKKVQSKKHMAPVGDNVTHVDSQPETPTRPLSWQPMEDDRLTQSGGVPGRQVDAGEHSDSSSGSSSLADSSSDDEGPAPVMEGQHGSEDEEEDGAKTPKQMRFKAPEHYTECSVRSKELNKEDAADCDLWLIKVPCDFSVADIDKKCVTIGGALMVKRTTEKDGASRVWEMEASHDDSLEASNWCVMLPSKKDNKLFPVGPFKGQICLTKSVQSLPYALPPVPTKHVQMPEGLKMRNVPFGADAPLRRKSKKKKKDQESWHGDDVNLKKHKKKRHLEDTENTADIMKQEPDDWTLVKHHKKHKTHKRHSIKVER